MQAFQSESKLYCCVNVKVKELFARIRHDICSLSASKLSVRLRTKWLWVWTRCFHLTFIVTVYSIVGVLNTLARCGIWKLHEMQRNIAFKLIVFKSTSREWIQFNSIRSPIWSYSPGTEFTLFVRGNVRFMKQMLTLTKAVFVNFIYKKSNCGRLEWYTY